MDLGLSGKRAMVAGASRGLGYAVARALAYEGARVSIASSDETAIREAAARIATETSAEILAQRCDVSSGADITRWADATRQRFGDVDMLFTNSGGPPAGPAVSFDDAAWQAASELLVFSVIRMVRAAVPMMIRSGGGAILVSTSSSVKEPIPNLGLSTVMRASVSALAKTLALELASENIRVNQIIPGRIDTDRVRHLDAVNAKKAGVSPEEQRARSIAAIPMGRYGAADEYGRAAAFLLSDAARYVTGATLQVDGGLIRSVL
jgi:3-oxoacyl-[acyl-carrier protein] reductase